MPVVTPETRDLAAAFRDVVGCNSSSYLIHLFLGNCQADLLNSTLYVVLDSTRILLRSGIAYALFCVE